VVGQLSDPVEHGLSGVDTSRVHRLAPVTVWLSLRRLASTARRSTGLFSVLLVLLALSNPMRVLLGLVIVALGVPVYYLLFRRRMLCAEKSREKSRDQSVRAMAPDGKGELT
jgi:hypothetical protein